MFLSYTESMEGGITMANVKTAISLEESLFHEVEAVAQEMRVPRSRLFVMAVEEFLRRRRNQALLEAINAAYDDFPDEQERSVMEAMQRNLPNIVDAW
jgi:metal-responsive CopG/Arc/MetJ family transcriptional regulator